MLIGRDVIQIQDVHKFHKTFIHLASSLVKDFELCGIWSKFEEGSSGKNKVDNWEPAKSNLSQHHRICL